MKLLWPCRFTVIPCEWDSTGVASRCKGTKRKWSWWQRPCSLERGLCFCRVAGPPLPTSKEHIALLFQPNQWWPKRSAFLAWPTWEALPGSRSPTFSEWGWLRLCLRSPSRASGAGPWACQQSQVNCHIIPGTAGTGLNYLHRTWGKHPFLNPDWASQRQEPGLSRRCWECPGHIGRVNY